MPLVGREPSSSHLEGPGKPREFSSSPESGQRSSSPAVANHGISAADAEKKLDSDNSPADSDSSGGEAEFKEGGYGW